MLLVIQFENRDVEVTVDGKLVSLSLFRSAKGGEDYDNLRPLDYPHTNIFLLCFSVMNPSSFDNIRQRWLPEVDHHVPEAVIVIVGTKIDLREDKDALESLASKHLAPVTYHQGKSLAEEASSESFNVFGYFEISALTGKGLKELFEEATRAALSGRSFKSLAHNDHKDHKCVVM